MRIISGRRRGAVLTAPEGGVVRPTADRVREGLFNTLLGGRYGNPLDVPVVADIFAGAGTMGLEAWSRGARQVIFVENNPSALAALEKNISKCASKDATFIVPRDATRRLAWPAAPAGLLFIDPPWRKSAEEPDPANLALQNFIRHGLIAPSALISIEHDHRSPPELPLGISWLETRKWGRSACTIARYEGAGS